MKKYFFKGYVAGENFAIPEDVQSLINAHLNVRNEILNSDTPRPAKKSALIAHDKKLKWETIWAENNLGQHIPTAILTI